MTRVSYMSDIHLEFGGSKVSFEELYDTDVVVLAGDIGTGMTSVKYADYLSKETGLPVIFVPGNHEFYHHDRKELLREMKSFSASSDSQVFILDNDIVIINDIVFIGTTLWTDFNLYGKQKLDKREAGLRINDFNYILEGNRKFNQDDSIRLFNEAISFLENAFMNYPDDKKVVVTHYGVSHASIHPKYAGGPLNACFASNLFDFFNEKKPEYIIHGHTHEKLSYNIGETKVLCNPKGYPSEEKPYFNFEFFDL